VLGPLGMTPQGSRYLAQQRLDSASGRHRRLRIGPTSPHPASFRVFPEWPPPICPRQATLCARGVAIMHTWHGSRRVSFPQFLGAAMADAGRWQDAGLGGFLDGNGLSHHVRTSTGYRVLVFGDVLRRNVATCRDDQRDDG